MLTVIRDIKKALWSEFHHEEWFAGCMYSRRDGLREVVLMVKSDKRKVLGRRGFAPREGVKIRVETVPPEVYLIWEEERLG